MRISDCRALVTCPGRNFVLVKITTDNGLVGWGDATLNGRELAVATLIEEHLRHLLIGEEAGRIEHLWNLLYTGAYWRGGPVQNTALAGIDMALWDILGKAAGMPVYQLLGGRVRDGAIAYANSAGTNVEQVIAGVHDRIRAGFKACRIQLEMSAGSTYGEKSHPGARTTAADGGPLPSAGQWEPTPYLRALPQMFREVRQAVGEEIELLHDVHHRLSPIQAAQLAKEIEPYHPFFLEDPVAPEYRDGLVTIRQASTTPIAIGEGFFDISTCYPLMADRLLDYLRCDLGHIGGITPARKLAHMAEPLCIRTAWHGPPDLSPVGHAANVHVDLSVSNFGIQEWFDHRRDPNLRACNEVFKGGVIARDGCLDAPDAPGLGIEVDEDAARKYPYKRGYLPVVFRADGSVYPW